MYYTDQHKRCDYVLKLDGPYDVGLDRQADGTYAVVYDEWNGRVAKSLGASCPMPDSLEGRAQHQIGRFMQAYAKHAAINAAALQGYMVESATVDEHNNVHLSIAV